MAKVIVYVSKNLVHMISLFYASFVLLLMFSVLVGGLHEDLEKDPRVLDPRWFHLDYEISVAHANYFHTNRTIFV